jgi:asparagine synthase (glutamine-hydrolysing)
MCGIAGFLGTPTSGSAEANVKAMTDAIAHRGPDADGAWCDDAAQIALGHRRLSIIDLSPSGAQPMTSATERYIIVFNGEAYNYAPIRAELLALGYPFRGHSDTEVLLASFDRWGIVASIPKFAGMFAMAVWDREERTLWLVRDRLGEKPLFFGQINGTWLFGSELKALRAFSGWRAAIDISAVTQFLRHGYIQAPASIYREVRKVLPGTAVEIKLGRAPKFHTYWSASQAAQLGRKTPLLGNMDDVVTQLDDTLRPILRDEMMADVPVGAFLSGGVDSSLLVALMQTQSSRPIRTFTIGFEDPRFNEAEFARDVAQHLGTDHTELIARGEDALQLVSTLPQVYDEPMADPSQLPTLLVSQLTRRDVTVAISGDGGDELFGGYSWYTGKDTAATGGRPGPAMVRKLVGTLLRQIPDPPPNFIARALSGGDVGDGHRPANALTRLGASLEASGRHQEYLSLLAHTVAPSDLLRAEFRAAAGDGTLQGTWLGDDSTAESRMLFDATSYMADDILAKVDRAAMAYSLETRAPLLDHRVFEFAWRVPHALRIIDGVGKQPLRHLLYRHVPRRLIERPKRGFAIPVAAWLRGPLKPWAEDLLSASSIAASGVLDTRRVRRMWQQHQEGLADHGTRLWAVLALLAFLRAETAALPHRRSA